MKPFTLFLIGAAIMLGIYLHESGQWQSLTGNFFPAPGNELIYEKSTSKSFIDTAEDAAFAVSERNFRITNTLRIGKAIRERGNNNFPEYDVILFCNIQYAQSMLELDPSYVNFCPGQIAVREGENQSVYISAPLVPKHSNIEELNFIIDEVNHLVRESVDFAAREWQEVSD